MTKKSSKRIATGRGKSGVPARYRCDGCRAHGCKLWRNDEIFVCAQCAAKIVPGVDPAQIGPFGLRIGDDGLPTRRIGEFVPAIPVPGENIFATSKAPVASLFWWVSLPTLLPAKK